MDVSIDQLEELGLIAFYGDWCSVHSDWIKDAQALDLSLQPMLEALRILRDIRTGNVITLRPQLLRLFEQIANLHLTKGLQLFQIGETNSRALPRCHCVSRLPTSLSNDRSQN